ncbi:DEAD/DEAH box helicase [Thalassospira xianhensis]|uniref:DNA2/NAM7 helicase-like C-terminal domain-containing protein n=1 Tax=Thalassospira xianhensis MCCC 1A02616 TaxID=1177929 RepID=A0A367UKX6_9PROT|nr:DEAD/DEAH box helicase [Thalassospira xianhensis]RCK07782.1 hypothetical protein TH5_01690 [Thalassospira xianhensis MCCC 1A02616]
MNVEMPSSSDDFEEVTLPELIDFSNLEVPARPSEPDTVSSVLKSWIALEVLSPTLPFEKPKELTDRKPHDVFPLNNGPLPWEGKVDKCSQRQHCRQGECAQAADDEFSNGCVDNVVFFEIVLGSIPLAPATRQIIDVYGPSASDAKLNIGSKKSVIATAVVNEHGHIVDVGVSSFAWGLPMALDHKLGVLSEWTSAEENIKLKLKEIFRGSNEEGDEKPVTRKVIKAAFEWMLDQCSLRDRGLNILEPSFCLRRNFKKGESVSSNSSILNSFFITDLELLLRKVDKGEELPKGVNDFLGLSPAPENPKDLLRDHEAIRQAVHPDYMPHCKWPGFPLVLLQQAAVNIAQHELKGKDGLMAVNGPPGTGKSTLLRDIVAERIYERACAMVKFSDPSQAFGATGVKITFGSSDNSSDGTQKSGAFEVFGLDKSLTGHEVVVASSNNKAVENISMELPEMSAVNGSDVRYFKSVSDWLYNEPPIPVKKRNSNNMRKWMTSIVANGYRDLERNTWGLIAAPLGKSANRRKFLDKIYFDRECGLRAYLKALIELDGGYLTEDTTPTVAHIEGLQPYPIRKAAWKDACTKFTSLQDDIIGEINLIKKAANAHSELNETRERISEIDAEIIEQTQRLKADPAGDIAYSNRLKELNDHLSDLVDEVAACERARPGMIAMFFMTKPAKTWKAEFHRILNTKAATEKKIRDIQREIREREEQQLEAHSKSERLKAERDELILASRRLLNNISVYKEKYGTSFVDEEFFEQGHDRYNRISPWAYEELNERRHKLFKAALDVHRCFILMAPRQMRACMSAFQAISSGYPVDAELKPFVKDIWSSIFLIVPVISTTFAAAPRMFKDVDPNTLGWLLIDEAGQACPQHAVGSIMRFKRTMVVGDPLQIEPVVILPEKVSLALCNNFRVTFERWFAPKVSAQVLADRCSRYQAKFETEIGSRMVGIPLLVHRRCREPMFSISNAIAYDDKMVHAEPAEKQTLFRQTWGPSTWFDVKGSSEDKWSKAEGLALVDLLIRLAEAPTPQSEPDLYIIASFRKVADELRDLLDAAEKKHSLMTNIGIKNTTQFLSKRVGTIHTVQGGEADSVVMVLGAPDDSEGGAREWAFGKTPNMLNVAVSRAKQDFYVIGSYNAWSSVAYAPQLGSRLLREAFVSRHQEMRLSMFEKISMFDK